MVYGRLIQLIDQKAYYRGRPPTTRPKGPLPRPTILPHIAWHIAAAIKNGTDIIAARANM
jgi:hypothetical protein